MRKAVEESRGQADELRSPSQRARTRRGPSVAEPQDRVAMARAAG